MCSKAAHLHTALCRAARHVGRTVKTCKHQSEVGCGPGQGNCLWGQHKQRAHICCLCYGTHGAGTEQGWQHHILPPHVLAFIQHLQAQATWWHTWLQAASNAHHGGCNALLSSQRFNTHQMNTPPCNAALKAQNSPPLREVQALAESSRAVNSCQTMHRTEQGRDRASSERQGTVRDRTSRLHADIMCLLPLCCGPTPCQDLLLPCTCTDKHRL